KVLTFFQEQGITHGVIPPFSHETNGIVERYTRTLFTMGCAMITDKTKFLWPFAMLMANYLKNRLPHRAIKGMTPYERFTGIKPSISYLRPFESRCYMNMHIPKEKRPAANKLLPRADIGLLVGFHPKTPTIHKIWIPTKRQFFDSREVIFAPPDMISE